MGGLLILLTVALISWHKSLQLEYAPVQSLRVLNRLLVFGILYNVWIAALVLFVFLEWRSRTASYMGLILIGSFALVYRGMWDLLMPDWWVDGLSNIITAEAISTLGRVPRSVPNFPYWEFPGLHVLASSLSQVTSLEMFKAVAFLQLTFDVFLGWLYYLVFHRLLSDSRSACLSAILAMMGNVVYAALFFYPGFLGLIFIGLFFLFLLDQQKNDKLRQGMLVVPLLLGAVTITHFVSSMVFLSFLLGLGTVSLLEAKFVREARMPQLEFSTSLFIGIPVAWLVFWGTQSFHNLVILGSEIQRNLRLDQFLGYAFQGVSTNIGASLPLWARTVRVFWLLTIFGLGSILSLVNAFRIRRLNLFERVVVGCFLGVGALSLTVTLVSTRGFEYFRYLFYAPFFTVPFLLKACQDFRPFRKLVIPGIGIVIAALSLPTFLVHHASVEQYAFYPAEYAAGRFLSSASASARGRQLMVFGLGFSALPVIYFVPDSVYLTEGQASIDLVDKQGLWRSVEKQVAEFTRPGATGRGKVFVISERPRVYYRHLFGVDVDDPRWRLITERLSDESAIVYENGGVHLYLGLI
jgi:hypothetical protein